LKATCTSADAKIAASIKGLEANSNESQNELNKWKDAMKTAAADRKKASLSIKTAKVQLDGLRKRADQMLVDYRVHAEESDQKLNVVKMLRDIISDELLNPTPGSFVQLNKFQAKLNELKNLLNNNSDSLYAPIVSVLLDLATEQNFTNQAVLRRILQNLNNLDKSLRDFRAKLEKDLADNEKNLKGQMSNTLERIDAYARMRAQATSKGLDAKHYIRFYTHEMAHFKAEKGRKEDERKLFTKLCQFQAGVHKKDKKSFQRWKKSLLPYLFNSIQKLK